MQDQTKNKNGSLQKLLTVSRRTKQQKMYEKAKQTNVSPKSG